ncbi:hypothetical protein GCM10027051_16560 [Niabella terrae]
MQLSTRYIYQANPEQLWPLLFGSQMDERHPCRMLCGLPKPVECRLEDGQGGVGRHRECISDKGIIKQEILQWEPARLLEFKMVDTNIYFKPCVTEIIERFELQAKGDGQTVFTRRTRFRLRFPASLFAVLPMYIGLKSIHYYVCRNWESLLKRQETITD